MTLVAHKIELRPNHTQAIYFAKACGIARFAYNWGLVEWQRIRESNGKPSWPKITKLLRSVQDQSFPWMREVTKFCPEIAIQNLGTAFCRFINWYKKGRKGQRIGFPRFKKKGKSRDVFCAAIANGKDKSIEVNQKCVKLARIGWVRMRQEVRFNGRIIRATVSRVVDRWFVSLLIDTSDIKPVNAKTKQQACGVDLGVKTLATLYDGELYQEVEGPKSHRILLRRLRYLSRSLARKKLGSANWRKVKYRIANLHLRITRIRLDFLHKLTGQLSRRYKTIGIENLNVSGMMKNRRLSCVIADSGFFEFRRQLIYKCKWYDSELIVADRFFPSSKMCSNCKFIYSDLKLSDRVWVCSNCKTEHNRDCVAAKNLRDHAVGCTVLACGANNSGLGVQSLA